MRLFYWAIAAASLAAAFLMSNIVSHAAEDDVHRAVRENSYSDLQALIGRGVNLNTIDESGRSPLRLALETKHKSIAQLLLRSGARFTLEPTSRTQQADFDYASDPDLAPYFQIALLKTPLLNLEPHDAAHNPAETLTRVARSSRFQVGDPRWHVVASNCMGYADYRGQALDNHARPNTSFVFPLTTSRTAFPLVSGDPAAREGFVDDVWSSIPSGLYVPAQSIEFGLSSNPPGLYRRTVYAYPYDCNGQWSSGRLITVTFNITATLTIPGCDFNFATDPTCYPSVWVVYPGFQTTFTNVSEPRHPSDESATLEADTPVSVKQGATSTLVQPFRTKQFDRTNGALEISFGPFSQKKVLAQFSVVVADGPDLTVSGNIDPPARLALYRRIAIAKNAFDVVSADTRPDAAIRAKTLATAVHALSASAVQEKYPQVVRQLLQTEAQAIAAADNLGRDIRDLIVANDMLTPEQITTFKERINIALETAPPELKPQLERIKAEIELEERAATQLESAVRVLRDNFETDLDRMIAEYQSLVLEYAQYIPASELAAQSPVPAPTRARLANVLRPADVMIGDAALGGRGAAIRAAFGVTAAAR